jgi:hypothetical protein
VNLQRRSLCIVSRDPSLCGELVLSLQALLDPRDEVEIIMDRRCAPTGLETRPGELADWLVDRRRSAGVDLEVRTKGFAIVCAPIAPGSSGDSDTDEYPRFDNLLCFRAAASRASGRDRARPANSP